MNESKEKLKEALEEILNESREKGRDQLGRAKQAMQEKRERFRGYVRENPEKSAMIAAGTGAAVVLLAMMMGCAFRNRRNY